MPKVFVSHASADQDYADSFVNDLLVRGARIPLEDVFYSSAADTGVASGRPLIAEVQKQVAGATLILALVTPTFQTRPVCVAELGAAWGMGRLFPLMSPGMDRSSLEGVLPGLAIRSSSEEGALDELAQALAGIGYPINVASWGTGKRTWKSHQATIQIAEASQPTIEDLNALRAELAETTTALGVVISENDVMKKQIAALKLAKDAAEVSAILGPREDGDRFRALVEEAKDRLRRLDAIVVKAVWYRLRGDDMVWPQVHLDPEGVQAATHALEAGYLIEPDDHLLAPSDSFPKVAKALDSVEALQTFLTKEAGEGFLEWFREEYEVPADLTKGACWNLFFSPSSLWVTSLLP